MLTAPNGCRSVSFQPDEVVQHATWQYIIDLDWRLWVRAIKPAEIEPWELVIDVRPVRRTGSTRRTSRK